MTFDHFARNLNAALLRINMQDNIVANYIHEHRQTEGAWDRCVLTARRVDECIDLEVEIEDLIWERERAAAERRAA